MIQIPSGDARRIEREAEAAYPGECCGLLAGRAIGGVLRVTRLVPSRNIVAPASRDRFEVDPQIRFDLMRRLEGTEESLIGHYHSHPDHPAQPSAHDLERAFEPDLVWLIVSVIGGTAREIRAHRPDADQTRFREEALEVVGQG
ncbi:MAG: M67 family metallopeptidase [Rhodospirillales bacterium]|nr:M67 family metallopeptidase [Rhodospirillales bacterium]